jgi:hypothetical protein
MTRMRGACRVRGICLWIGLGAFLVAEPGACLAQARPPSPGPPDRAGASAVAVTGAGIASSHPSDVAIGSIGEAPGGAGVGIPARWSIAAPSIGMRLAAPGAPWTRFLAGTAGDNAQGSASAGGTPVYKKAWFIAAAVGVVAVAVLLLASGGSDDGDEPGPQPESLPGFPPPPTLPASIGSGGSAR